VVNNVPLLERNIKFLQSFGINEFVINVHHFGEQIIEFLKKKKILGQKLIFPMKKTNF
jgi:NDP-sugar pyrophosphorylase family protein